MSWDLLSQLGRRSCGSGRGWALLKADHADAYNQLPIAPADQARAAIALCRPKSWTLYGFTARTLMFRAKAAGLQYDAFSRLATALVNRLFGIPLICFPGDFASHIPRLLGAKAQKVSTSSGAILGILPKPGKSEVGSRISFLCLRGWFPGRANDFLLEITPPGEKRAGWVALICDFIRNRPIARQELEKLIGRMSFSQALLFRACARTQLRSLYQKLHRRAYNARLTADETDFCALRERAIRPFTPCVCRPSAQTCDWIVCTYAATSHPNICALRFRGTSKDHHLDSQLPTDVPAVWV